MILTHDSEWFINIFMDQSQYNQEPNILLPKKFPFGVESGKCMSWITKDNTACSIRTMTEVEDSYNHYSCFIDHVTT